MTGALFWWTGAAVWTALAAAGAVLLAIAVLHSWFTLRFMWLLHHTKRFDGTTGPAFNVRRDARLFVSIFTKHPTLILRGTGQEIAWPGRLQECADD